MPRLVADIYSGALAPRSALGYARIPGQVEWELLPVAVAILTPVALPRYECLDLQNPARETELAWCFSVSFVRKRGPPSLAPNQNASWVKWRGRILSDTTPGSTFYTSRSYPAIESLARHNLGTFPNFGASAPEPKPQKTGAAHSSATSSEAAAAFYLNGQSLG